MCIYMQCVFCNVFYSTLRSTPKSHAMYHSPNVPNLDQISYVILRLMGMLPGMSTWVFQQYHVIYIYIYIYVCMCMCMCMCTCRCLCICMSICIPRVGPKHPMPVRYRHCLSCQPSYIAWRMDRKCHPIMHAQLGLLICMRSRGGPAPSFRPIISLISR